MTLAEARREFEKLFDPKIMGKVAYQYGADEKSNAWNWYLAGWTAGQLPSSKVEQKGA